MLVLTRRSQQSIMIGKDIVITILEVRGDQVRIGVSAPRDVDVHREEVFLELEQANQAAASPSAEAVGALGALLPPEDSRPVPEQSVTEPAATEPAATAAPEQSATEPAATPATDPTGPDADRP